MGGRGGSWLWLGLSCWCCSFWTRSQALSAPGTAAHTRSKLSPFLPTHIQPPLPSQQHNQPTQWSFSTALHLCRSWTLKDTGTNTNTLWFSNTKLQFDSQSLISSTGSQHKSPNMPKLSLIHTVFADIWYPSYFTLVARQCWGGQTQGNVSIYSFPKYWSSSTTEDIFPSNRAVRAKKHSRTSTG